MRYVSVALNVVTLVLVAYLLVAREAPEAKVTWVYNEDGSSTCLYASGNEISCVCMESGGLTHICLEDGELKSVGG